MVIWDIIPGLVTVQKNSYLTTLVFTVISLVIVPNISQDLGA